MRQEIIRIDNEYPPRGGGAGPFNPATGQGGIRPIPGDIIQNQNTDGRTESGSLNIWLTPHGFLKGAIANGPARITGTQGKKKLVSFTAFGKNTVTGTLKMSTDSSWISNASRTSTAVSIHGKRS